MLFDPNVTPTFIDPDNIQANPLNEDINLFILDEQVVENNFTSDRDIVGAVNVRFPLAAQGDFAGTIKAGLKYRDKRKTRDNNAVEFGSEDDLFLRDFIDPDFNITSTLDGRYQPGPFVGPSAARELQSQFPFESEVDIEENLADFTATEKTTAAYAMADLALGPNMTLLPGVRVETTNIDYTGFEILFDEEGDFASLARLTDSQDYTEVFPGVHWRYALTPDANVRAAFTRSMGRPNYADLVPSQLILEEDLEIVLGNPELQPTTSWNYDLLFEHYFQSVGVVSGGFFYKDITDFIFPSTFSELRGGETFDVLQPRTEAPHT